MHRTTCPLCHRDSKHVSGRAGLVERSVGHRAGGRAFQLFVDVFLSDPRWCGYSVSETLRKENQPEGLRQK